MSELALELQTAGDLILIVPVSVAVAVVGIGMYLVKKRDRQRERIARAHQPPSERSHESDGG